MKRYEMTPALRTGNEMIDMEHERIFEEVNALLEACQTGHARGASGGNGGFPGGLCGRPFCGRGKSADRIPVSGLLQP